MEQRRSHAVNAVYELGKAWGGDWKTYDGHLDEHLADISIMIVDPRISIEDFRKSHHLCLAGKGHWDEYCKSYGCECRGNNEIIK